MPLNTLPAAVQFLSEYGTVMKVRSTSPWRIQEVVLRLRESKEYLKGLTALTSIQITWKCKVQELDSPEDGQRGYELALKNDYDLIVSDVMMPNMSGTELCQKLKSNIKTSHVFVILLTVKSDISNTMEGYETGADSYITKPFLPKHLIQVIKNLLNTQLHIKTFYSSAEEKSQEPLGLNPLDKQFIENAIAAIEKNIDKEKFGVELLGKELGLSRTHLFRKFKSLTGSAPIDFIRQIRLKKAAKLIKEGKYSISEIAYMVGFNSPANFSTSFKAFYGMSPKAMVQQFLR